MLLLFIGIVITDGCKKDQSNNPVAATVANPDSKVYAYIKSLGYKDNQIVDIGTGYVVNGDITYPENAIIDTSEKPRRHVEPTGDGTYVAANTNVIIQVDTTTYTVS